MFRKHATSRPRSTTRSYLSAWLETSITRYGRQESAALRTWRHRSGDSGVVFTLSKCSTPSNVSIEPRIAARGSALPASKICFSM